MTAFGDAPFTIDVFSNDLERRVQRRRQYLSLGGYQTDPRPFVGHKEDPVAMAGVTKGHALAPGKGPHGDTVAHRRGTARRVRAKCAAIPPGSTAGREPLAS